MLAVQYSRFGPPDVLTLAPLPDPHPGPGEVRIAVRATGVGSADTMLRAGTRSIGRPLTWPHVPGVDAAGVVDEIGEGAADVVIGDEVFGTVDVMRLGGACAELAVLRFWTAKPAELDWVEAGAAGASVETATRVLDALDVAPGTTLLLDGASGAVGNLAIQLALARGARVIGTASPGHQDFLTKLGAFPTTYGPGLAERVAALAPDGVDSAADLAGAGGLGDLVAITGSPGRVVSIADLAASQHSVRLSFSGPGGGPDGVHGLWEAARLATEGKFHVPIRAVLPAQQAVQAHQLVEAERGGGRVVLTFA